MHPDYLQVSYLLCLAKCPHILSLYVEEESVTSSTPDSLATSFNCSSVTTKPHSSSPYFSEKLYIWLGIPSGRTVPFCPLIRWEFHTLSLKTSTSFCTVCLIVWIIMALVFQPIQMSFEELFHSLVEFFPPPFNLCIHKEKANII